MDPRGEAWDGARQGVTEGVSKRVFADPDHRRRHRLELWGGVILAFLLGWSISFGARLYLVQQMPFPPAADQTEAPAVSARAPDNPEVAVSVLNPTSNGAYPPPPAFLQDPLSRQMPTERVYAFLPYLPETTYASLVAGSRAIDVLMPEWYRLSPDVVGVETLNRQAEHQVYLQQWLDRSMPRVDVLPVVTVEHGGLPSGEGARTAIATLARDLAHLAVDKGYPGLGLLAEGLDATEQSAFATLAMDLDAELNLRGLSSALLDSVDSLSLGDAKLIAAMDLVVLKLFEEPWIGTPPGPLAAQDWVEQRARWAIDAVGRDKLVFMLGSFAIDWSRQAAAPRLMAVADAFLSLTDNGGALDFPASAGNMRIRYATAEGERHETWAVDAVGLYNQLALLSDLGMHQVGLWTLGLEDPSVWPLFAIRVLDPKLTTYFISHIDLSDFVSYRGHGAFQKLLRPAVPGQRVVSFDPTTGLITDEGFPSLPGPWSLLRYGRASPDEVAITFDDGPDPKYTEQILDILRERDATATFFVVGTRVLQAPATFRRIVAEGHIYGSHTFLHPRIEDQSAWRTRLEVNALQRLVAGLTARGTVLFRTPYGRSEGPLTGQTAAPMEALDQAGYLVVGSDVVPPDWLDLSSGEIVDYVMDKLATEGGNVIVFHDAGGDRQATVDALGPLIDRLRADGYRIVGLNEMLGVERDALMPSVHSDGVAMDRASFAVIGGVRTWLTWTFWLLVAVGLARASIVLVLALDRRPHYPDAGAYAPRVTVLVPAYNEEATITRCLQSILASTYPDLQILVIDDGSTDRTFEVVEAFRADHPQIELIHQPNGGKWKALNTAYSLVDTEIVVAIDADSMLAHDAISWLVPHFADPEVGAVAGMVRVGNRRGLLTRLQALEYMTAQAIDRRAFERLNAMLVVPGAIGAWRADAVRAAGLYSSDTLTEDADLTIAVNRAGYRVVYEEHAYAVTEVPETVRLLLRQRLRWSFGMLQSAFKHLPGAARQHLPIGRIALPDLLVVGYVFSVLAPLVDMMLVVAILNYLADKIFTPVIAVSAVPWQMVLGYAFLPLLDVVIILVALRFDRHENIGLVLLVPVQRFFYRQLLYLSALRAIFRAAMGTLTSWGVLKRTGNARLTTQR